jgi:hypothetical protein
MNPPAISKEWTHAERIRVVRAMLSQIQTDIAAGRYSAEGRPNITACEHVFTESAETLEAYRVDLEKTVTDAESGADLAGLVEVRPPS